MNEKNNPRMRNYISNALYRGYSLYDIEKALINQGYTEKLTHIILEDYTEHRQKKGRLISNNLIAGMVLLIIIASGISNYFVLSSIPNTHITGRVTGSLTGSVTMCVNSMPAIDISQCPLETNVSEEYYCVVTSSDPNADYSLVFMSYYDNTSLFNITELDEWSAAINFTPQFPDHLGGQYSLGKNHSFLITASDESTCDNENASAVLNLFIKKGCSVKTPPLFVDLEDNYTLLRNRNWVLDTNATDADFEDNIVYSVSEVSYTATMPFNYLSFSDMTYNYSTGIILIRPTIRHLNGHMSGVHVLNISASDTSTCSDNTVWRLVNLTVDANNIPPYYIGQPRGLDRTWNEGRPSIDIDLDRFFNDSDGDCLTYLFEPGSCNLAGETCSPSDVKGYVIIENAGNPVTNCRLNHPVRFNISRNAYGKFSGWFYANDSINLSEGIYAEFTITNLPEIITIPEGAKSSPGAGGGGGAGPSKATRCEEKWYCARWSNCIDGFMSRNCTDMNNCHTTKFKPNETESCRYIEHCNDGQQNMDEEGVDCGGECPVPCTTCNDAIMNCHSINSTVQCEEGIDCGGPCQPCTPEDNITISSREKQQDILSPEQSLLGYYSLIGLLLLLFLIILIWLTRKISKKLKEMRKEKHPFKDFLKNLFDLFKGKKKERISLSREKPSHNKAREIKEEKKKPEIFTHLKNWLMRFAKKKEITDQKIIVSDTTAKLEHLLSQIGKEPNDKIAKELSVLMRDWLKRKFNVEYEATYEELGSELSKKRKEQIVRDKVEPFFNKLIEIEYSGEEPTTDKIRSLLLQAIKLSGFSHAAHASTSRPSVLLHKEKTSKKKTRTTVAVIIMILITVGVFFMLRPEITGNVIQGLYPDTIAINRNFTTQDTYPLNLGNDISSFKISGMITRGADVKVYLGKEDENNLVFDSALFFLEHNSSLNKIKTDQVKQFEDGVKEIDLKIDYKSGTPWDDDDDGVTSLEDSIDITIENSVFSWNVSKDKLCTLWSVNNGKDVAYTCYGNYDCCSLLDLVPERDGWDDTFYLTYEKYGSKEDNQIQAKLIYANYSLDTENPYSDIAESETETISAIFESDNILFSNVCFETCSVKSWNANNLLIKLAKGTIFISNATYSLTSSSKDQAPVFSTIPNITIESGAFTVLDLHDYVTYPNKNSLLFDVYASDDIQISIDGGVARIVSSQGFTGKSFAFFMVNDSYNGIVSNMVEITVIDVNNKTIQGKAQVGKAVKWTKRLQLNGSNTVRLDYIPLNVTVHKLEGASESRIDDSLIGVNVKGSTVSLDEYLAQGKLSDKSKKAKKGERSISQSSSMDENPELVISDQAEEIEVEYYTEAPISREENVSENLKRVIISANISYTEITAFTTIDEKPLNSIKISHLVDGNKVPVQFIAYDHNDNGLIDYVEWIVPHLSEQIYEIEITVLNIQSYPTVGGNWTVEFTTFGKSNLILSAINETSYGTVTPYDLAPLVLKCGNDSLDYNWDSGNSVIYNDYECNSTGYWTVKVLTEGIHNQRFMFGDEVAYANNYASVESGETNLTIWDDTDTNSNLKSTDTIHFYANYTNGTLIANGTCTIKFNLTGDWQSETNMVYNGEGLPWNYSRYIPYKNITYYLINCSNESMNTLNTIDSIFIMNSPPVLNTSGGKLPSLNCIEDQYCSYNFSMQANDSDLNDQLTYDYTAGSVQSLTSHPDCNNCWNFDFNSGNLTVYVTTTAHANTGPFSIELTAKDNERAPAAGTLTVTVAAVNDYPVITDPSGVILPSTIVDTSYLYDINATDEEDGTNSANFVFNYTIVSCNRYLDVGHASDCTLVSNWYINHTTGVFNISPTIRNDVGNYTLNISVKDSANALTWKLVNFTIIDNNVPPVFDWLCNESSSALEDVPFECIVNATDANNNPLTYTSSVVGEVEQWFNINASGHVNFTARNEHVGNHTINLTVTDGYFTTSSLINFTVNNSNDAPWLYNITPQIAIVDLEYGLNITAHDDDFWQPYMTYYSTSESLFFGINLTWLSITKINDTTARINFTPTEAQKGDYIIFVNVTDTYNVTSNLTFNLTVRNNTAPQFGWICDDSRTIQEEVLFNCTINATDLEGDSFTFLSNESWFIVNSTTGNVSFTADDEQVGNHTLEFTVLDIWGAYNIFLVNFTVLNTPEAPVFFGVENMTAIQGVQFVYNLSANVSDEDMNTPEKDTLYYYVNYSLPSGLFSINETTGLINFTSTELDPGSYLLNFTVNDSFHLQTSIVVNFTVINVNDGPLILYACNDSRSAVEDIHFNCTLNATDSDNDNLTFASNVSWFNIDWLTYNTSLVNFTPLNEHVGNHTINISVTDDQYTSWLLINFSVQNVNDVPVLHVGNLNATEDLPFNYTINATDDDLQVPVGEVLIYGTNSTIFVINSTNGYFNFTPNVSQVGNYTILFNVTDSQGLTDEVIINFTIFEFNDVPLLLHIPDLSVDEGDTFWYDINSTDEEDVNDTSGLMTFSWNHTQGWFSLNATYGIVNFTATSAMIGTTTINITVTDSGGKNASQIFNITVRERNYRSNITQIMPYGSPLSDVLVENTFADRYLFSDNMTSITLYENTTILFNHTSLDLNPLDTINSSWYKDTVLLSSSNVSHYAYAINFLQAGQHNITLIVSDGRGGNDSFTWNVTVVNVNRVPVFGTVEHVTYLDFSGGTTNQTNLTQSGILLENSGGAYYTRGEFISSSIDLGALFSSFYSPIGLTNISWNALMPVGTNVTLQTATSHNNQDWSNWSADDLGRMYNIPTGEDIISPDATFIKYKATLSTEDTSVTPTLTSVKIEYILPDLNMTEGDMNPLWIDLDDYFHDLDADDIITYTVSNHSYVNLSIDSITHVVSITALNYGEEIIHFIAGDSYDNVISNNLTINIEPVESLSAIEYLYITNTRTVMKTRTRTITEPRYLELIAPKHISAFSDDTVVAPLVIKNNGESILNGITLTSHVNADEVTSWFSIGEIDILAPGQTKETDLFIKWRGTINEFDIVINATSTEPDFTDSAIISVTGVSRVENNRSIHEQQIQFVRDLLNNNPECLELTELLTEAEKSFKEGDTAKTRNTLNFIIEGCRYLITAKKDIEQPTPIKQREGDLYKLIAGVLLLLLFIALVVIVALVNRERRLGK